jgi:magnesium transporter
MYNFYAFEGNALQTVAPEVAAKDTSRVVWIDLCVPSVQEETFVEQLFSISIPTSDEMHEIELSNRLYQENGALYATFTIVTKSDTPLPEMASVTFVLVGNTLISVRYSDPQPFRVIQGRLQKIGNCKGVTVLAELMETVINRMADILESIGHQMA